MVVALASRSPSASPAIEVFRLLGQAGYPSIPLLGIAMALGIVVDGAIPTNLDGSGLILVAIGTILAASGSFAKRDPRDGLPTWFATVFGALYVVAARVRGPARRRGAGAADERAARVPRRRARLDPAPRPGRVVLRHRRVSHRQAVRPAKFLTHISPSKTYAGLIGGLAASTIVVTAMAVRLGEIAAASGSPSGRCWGSPPRPATSPNPC